MGKPKAKKPAQKQYAETEEEAQQHPDKPISKKLFTKRAQAAIAAIFVFLAIVIVLDMTYYEEIENTLTTLAEMIGLAAEKYPEDVIPPDTATVPAVTIDSISCTVRGVDEYGDKTYMLIAYGTATGPTGAKFQANPSSPIGPYDAMTSCINWETIVPASAMNCERKSSNGTKATWQLTIEGINARTVKNLENELKVGAKVFRSDAVMPAMEVEKTAICKDTPETTVTPPVTPTEPKTAKIIVYNSLGGGIVDSSPAGIYCGQTCEYDFPLGTSVTLTATPEVGWMFDTWGVADCPDSYQCTLVADQDRAVMPVFVSSQEPGSSSDSSSGSVEITKATCTFSENYGLTYKYYDVSLAGNVTGPAGGIFNTQTGNTTPSTTTCGAWSQEYDGCTNGSGNAGSASWTQDFSILAEGSGFGYSVTASVTDEYGWLLDSKEATMSCS